MNKITQSLDLRQSQQLVMTPQLQQAIKLLQLNNMELAEFIEEELEKNPLLEKDESTPETDAPEPTEEKDEMDTTFEESNTNDDFDAGSSMAEIGAGGNSNFEDIENSFENQMSKDATLREHLTEQLMISCDDARDRMIGGLLIDQLDEAGYLRTDHEELAEQLGCSQERIENLLVTLKGFDPTGVFAADLSDCLALQLEEQGKLDDPMKMLLENLNMLGDHDLKGLAAK